MFDMVLTLTVNPALDVTLWVPELDFSEPVKSEREAVYAGSKALNSARVLTRLGVPNRALGLAGQDNILPLERLLLKDGVSFDLIAVQGSVRENLSLVFPDGRLLKINRGGSPIQPGALWQLREKIRDAAQEYPNALWVFAGSLPPGMEKEEYKDLILLVKSLGALVAVDTAVFQKKDYEEIHPFVMKPNQREFYEIIGKKPRGRNSLEKSVKELCGCTDHLLLSLGEQGLIYGSGKGPVQFSVPSVEVKSTIGAGDTTLAGFLSGLFRGLEPKEAARFAAAAGTASVRLEGTEAVSSEMVGRILERVEEIV